MYLTYFIRSCIKRIIRVFYYRQTYRTAKYFNIKTTPYFKIYGKNTDENEDYLTFQFKLAFSKFTNLSFIYVCTNTKFIFNARARD